MNREELEVALALVLAPIDDKQRRERIATMLLDQMPMVGDIERDQLRALDEAIISAHGGYAFHWEDAFGLSLAAESMVGFLSGLSPTEAAAVLLAVLEFWRRLRHVRVPISHDEFFVMEAVKRGCTTRNSIAASSGLSLETVDEATSLLKKRVYREDVALLDGEDGSFVTSF